MSMHILWLFLPLAFMWLKTLINLMTFIKVREESKQRQGRALHKHRPQQGQRRHKLFIITPALNEQENIAGYIAHVIQRLLKQPGLLAQAVIVCNENEQPANSSPHGSHTWEIADHSLRESAHPEIAGKFDVIRYTGHAKRPGQINEACRHLVSQHQLSEQDFVLLLDVDAILDEDFFDCISAHIEHAQADLAQAQCIYQPRAANLGYDRAAAQWQNYFMLSRERGRLMRRERLNQKGAALKDNFWYTANGVVMRYSLIESIGGFVEDCKVDDLATSCLVCSIGCRVALLDTFLSVDQVSGSMADFRQKLFWCSSYVEMFKLLGPGTTGHRPHSAYIAFRLACFFVWLLRAPVIVGAVLACLVEPELVGISILSYAIYLASSYAFPFFFLPRTRTGGGASWCQAVHALTYPLLQSFVPWAMLVQKLITPTLSRGFFHPLKKAINK